MPSNPTFPGVYIEEVPNGARSITGVATSVTAFVGHASHGPLNQAIHLLSFADFERHFGGLDAKSELSNACRHFFSNGGTEAWVVRLAKNAIAAAQADTSNSQTADVTLAGGHEEPYPAEEAYHLLIADRSAHQGIFALEAVNLFNLLVLPGVTDPAILLDSSTYCQKRSAFLIADAPP